MKKNEAVLVIDGSAVAEETKKKKRNPKAVKLCAVLLAVMVLAGAVLGAVIGGSASFGASAAGEITVFSQTDSRWGSHPYGYKYNSAGAKVQANVSGGGCGILSLVNAVYYMNGSFIEPAMLADYSVNNGFRVTNVGTSHALYPAFSNTHGGTYGFYCEKADGTTSWSVLRDHLNGGGTAIASVKTIATGSGHLLVIADYDSSTGKYLILDSYASGNRGTKGGYAWRTESDWKSRMNFRGFTLLSSTKQQSPPPAPTVSLSSTMLKVGEEATLTWSDCPTATYYWASGWSETKHALSQECSGGSLKVSFDEPGAHSITVVSGNGAGESVGNWINFYVYDAPPEAPTVSLSKTVLAVGEQATLTWSDCPTATYYWASGWTQTRQDISQECSGGSLNVSFDEPDGHSITVVSGNGAGESVGNWIHFYVYDSAPKTSVLTLDKSEYDKGETVTFTASSDRSATGYTLGIFKGSERIDTISLGENTVHTASFSEPGEYSAYVTSSNSLGYTDSEFVGFTVRESLNGDRPADIGSDFYAYLRHQSTGRCMTNRSGDILGEEATGGPEQVWKFIRGENGTYVIESALDGGCVDVLSSGREDGTRVYVYSGGYVGGANQRFYIYNIHGAYYLTPEHISGSKMLDMGLDTFRMELWGTGSDWAPQEFDIEVVTYALTYDANGGQNAPAQGSKFYDSLISVDGGVPVREGFEFAGWNTAPDGSGTAYRAGEDYAGNADLTLYAQWTPIAQDIPFSLTMLGGSVRLIEPYGLRFGVQLLKDEVYKEHKDSIISYGTLIIPEAILDGGELTLNTPGVKIVPADVLYSSDSGQLTYTGVVTDIPESAFVSEIAGRGYLVYLDGNGCERVAYTEQISRSYYSVVSSAYERYSAMTNRSQSEQQTYEVLKKLLDSMPFGDNLIGY